MPNAKLKVSFHPEATAELRAAFLWYYERNPIVAQSFQKEAIRAVKAVSENSLLSPEIELRLRKCVFHCFPFNLIYRVKFEIIQVIAVAHQKRKPGYWKYR